MIHSPLESRPGMLDTPAQAATQPHCHFVRSMLRSELTERGWMSFARYMELALYAPSIGYYQGSAEKLGRAGDFMTAPEMTPVYGQTLAAQVGQILEASAPAVLEFGAGTGSLAIDLLRELARRGSTPEQYFIIEISSELRAAQQERIYQTVPDLAHRVEWLDALPPKFSGCVVANEVLDAMPVHLVVWREDGIFERGVSLDAQGGFEWQDRAAGGPLLCAASALPPRFPYLSEINLAARAWMREWSQRLQRGAVIVIDYGFPRHEYYHPQRAAGTLMCHSRHRSHTDPLFSPGMDDITAHVDFSAIADAALDAGLDLVGYTSQAQFLINCGLMQILERSGDPRSPDYLRAASAANRLVSPAEMGELFKVMAVGRGVPAQLIGFRQGDRRYALG